MAAEQPPTVRRRKLGSDLRRLRTAAGKSLDDAAAVLECHKTKVSRIENGRLAVRARDVRDLLDLYEVTDPQLRATLERLAREGKKRGWWEEFGTLLPPKSVGYLGPESDANYIRAFQMVLIPGLLQTDEYTRAVVNANPDSSPDAVEALLHVRKERKAILTRDDQPVRFWGIVAESALRLPVGGRGTMAAQLWHLWDMTQLPNVTLQVLPESRGAHPGMSGSFVIFSFPLVGDTDVVYVENLTSALYLEEMTDTRNFTLVFDELRSISLTPAESVEFIENAAKLLAKESP
ncbi:helix-turn-helix domain-containing protein [Embleya sp. NPDC001921]